MKKLIYLFVLLAFVACNPGNKSSEKSNIKTAEIIDIHGQKLVRMELSIALPSP